MDSKKNIKTSYDLEDVDQFSQTQVGIATLERYTGSKATDFQPYILLTNFHQYITDFATKFKEPIYQGSAMSVCHCAKKGISIINYHLGSPMAALMVDMLSFIKPKATLMLGLCGGLRPEHTVGSYFLPVAAIREEGTSDAYMPPRCPSLASFLIQRYASEALETKKIEYFRGVIHTTNVRFWEFNEEFKKKLQEERAQTIDMECATLFTVGFARYVPIGALMLISDLPLKSKGIKIASFNKTITGHAKTHLTLGISILQKMQKEEKKKGLTYLF